MGVFDVEHFHAQALRPDLQLEYDNLFYACHRCNLAKGSQDVPDPSQVLAQVQVQIKPDGSVDGLNDDAQRVIDVLGLDSDRQREWRLIWMGNIELAEQCDPEHYCRLMGFPEDLPDLSTLRPSSNSRPAGVQRSWFAKRQRHELPRTY